MSSNGQPKAPFGSYQTQGVYASKQPAHRLSLKPKFVKASSQLTKQNSDAVGQHRYVNRYRAESLDNDSCGDYRSIINKDRNQRNQAYNSYLTGSLLKNKTDMTLTKDDYNSDIPLLEGGEKHRVEQLGGQSIESPPMRRSQLNQKTVSEEFEMS